MSIGTLYQYFPNKDALLWSLAEQHLEATAAEVTDGARPRRRRGAPAAPPPPRPRPPRRRPATPPAPPCTASCSTRPRAHRTWWPGSAPTELALAASLAAHLRRLGVARSDPEAAALLAVQGVQAQIHGVMLTPPDGRDRDTLLAAIVTQWHRALTEW